MLKSFIRFIVTIAVIAGLVFGGYLYVMHTIETHTFVGVDENASPDDYFLLEIRSGMRPSDVLDLLYEEGLIRNNTIATLLIRFNNWGAIQAGVYQVYGALSLEEMFTMFAQGDIVEAETTRFTIPEGWRLEDIANILSDVFGHHTDELIALWEDSDFLTELIEEFWFLTEEILNPDLKFPLEGYFYPITYLIPEGEDSPEELTRAMLEMTQDRIAGLRSQIEEQEKTFHEILAFAAIIEAETQVAEDMPEVAGVFQNRLDDLVLFRGRLETDATIQYILEERVTHVLYEHTQIPSPFNSYLNPGLPPGPVNSPSQHAIRAVLNPAEHGYYFFITDMFGCYIEEGSDAAYSDPGRKLFAVTYHEHRANVVRYLQPSYDAQESVCNPNVQF